IVSDMPDQVLVTYRGSSIVCPLHAIRKKGEQLSLNIKEEFLNNIKNLYKKEETATGLEILKNNEILARKIFFYIYGILYSNRYRERWQSCLDYDMPRIPFPQSYKLFLKMSKKGQDLTDLHLLDELRSIPNECLHEFVDLTRQIDVCIEMALKIYKQGDVRVFGILRGGTFNDKIPKRALFSLEKKDFNKLQTPYVMNEEEFFDFTEFWKDFYEHVFDTEDFNDVIFLLYDTQNHPFDSIFFNYFKALEILFASDFIIPREKTKAFDTRV
ncbi:unnamed protein product, partial [marine sediment metagenome]